MAGLQDGLGKGEVSVIVFSENYQEALKNVIKDVEKKFKKVCYITTNKPYHELVLIFKKNNINLKRFGFIDAITNTVTKPPKTKQCVFVSSPNALTELSIAINKVSKVLRPDLYIFDSLSSLLVYEKGPVLIKFVHSLINSIKTYKIGATFTILESDIDSKLMKDLKMFADKVIKV